MLLKKKGIARKPAVTALVSKMPASAVEVNAGIPLKIHYDIEWTEQVDEKRTRN